MFDTKKILSNIYKNYGKGKAKWRMTLKSGKLVLLSVMMQKLKNKHAYLKLHEKERQTENRRESASLAAGKGRK